MVVVRIRVVLLLGWPHAEQLWMLASQTNSYCIKYDHPSPQRNTASCCLQGDQIFYEKVFQTQYIRCVAKKTGSKSKICFYFYPIITKLCQNKVLMSTYHIVELHTYIGNLKWIWILNSLYFKICVNKNSYRFAIINLQDIFRISKKAFIWKFWPFCHQTGI